MRRTRMRLWWLLALIAPFAVGSEVAGAAAPASGQAEPSSGQVEAVLEAPSEPVVLDGRTLFRLRGVTAYPAARRAAEVRERIRDLASSSFDPAGLTVVELPQETRIMAGERPVLRLRDADAELEGVEPRVLAEVYLNQIQEAIASYRAARTGEALGRSAWRVTLATVVAVLLLVGLRRLYAGVDRRVEQRFAERERGVVIRSFEVVRAQRLRDSARGGLRLVRTLAALVLLFLYANYVLALLPWTRGAASQLQEWVLAPVALLGRSLLEKLPDLVFLAVLFLLVRWALGLVKLFFAAVGRREVHLGDFESEWADPTYKIVRVVVIALALVVAYPYIPGSSSAAFKGISVFLGVLLSLGSSSMVSNIIAGYSMIYRRAFREGDVVKLGSVVGVVGRTRLQVTHLRTVKNEEVAIPNSSIAASEIVNYSTLAKEPGLVLYTTVGINYETPWRQVEAMLLEAAGATPGLLAEPKPFVRVLGLGDFAITYELNVYCDDPRSMRQFYSDLHLQILDAFNFYGVQIMTPAYEGDPQEPKVVPPDRWHLPPAAKE